MRKREEGPRVVAHAEAEDHIGRRCGVAAPDSVMRPRVAATVVVRCLLLEDWLPTVRLPSSLAAVTGAHAVVDVGRAQRIDEFDALVLARALVGATSIMVRGTDSAGVAAIRDVLDAAVDQAADEAAWAAEEAA